MAGLSMTAGPSFGSTFSGARLAVPSRAQVAPVYTGPIYAARIGPGKDWEHYPTNKNGKVQRVKMHVKTGDMVVVVAGSDKGVTGKVTKVMTKTGEVIVEGANKSVRLRILYTPQSEPGMRKKHIPLEDRKSVRRK